MMSKQYNLHKLSLGCTSQEAINFWLKRKQKINRDPNKIVVYNTDFNKVPIIWSHKHGDRFNMDIAIYFSKSLTKILQTKKTKIITCGLYRPIGKKFRDSHYYTVVIDTIENSLYILNPHGYRDFDSLLYKYTHYSLKRQFGINFKLKAILCKEGPQHRYIMDKGYCGLWVCIIAAHICSSKKVSHAINRISSYNQTKLNSNLKRIMKIIADEYTENSIKLPKLRKIGSVGINGDIYKTQKTVYGVKLPPFQEFC